MVSESSHAMIGYTCIRTIMQGIMELELDGMSCCPETLFLFKIMLEIKIGCNAPKNRLRQGSDRKKENTGD